MKAIGGCLFWGEIKERLGWGRPSLSWPEDHLRDIMMVEQAKAEWRAARGYFEEVTDPALIDFAIHNLEAAEKRMVYLIKMFGDKYPEGICPREGQSPPDEEETAAVVKG